MKMEKKQFIITKRIAKQGKNSIIIIPKILQEDLSPNTIVKLTIDVLKTGGKNEAGKTSTISTLQKHK